MVKAGKKEDFGHGGSIYQRPSGHPSHHPLNRPSRQISAVRRGWVSFVERIYVFIGISLNRLNLLLHSCAASSSSFRCQLLQFAFTTLKQKPTKHFHIALLK